MPHRGVGAARRVVWDRWQPRCDACGHLEASLGAKKQLLSCSGCLLAKYCSKDCQKKYWSEYGHKERCHLFEADRKLSTIFAKSLEPGTINDPTLSQGDKMIQWNFLNAFNHGIIAYAALKHAPDQNNMNIEICLRIDRDRLRSKYDNRSFIIDRVSLISRVESDVRAERINWVKGMFPFEATNSTEFAKLFVGFCDLPNGEMSETQLWNIPIGSPLPMHVLPPNFTLHRYITHVNRGITHFHGSYWPSSSAWTWYAYELHTAISGLKGRGVVGIQRPGGTRTPLYKWGTDTEGPEEFKKLLVDPSRFVRKLARELEFFECLQEKMLEMSEITLPIPAVSASATE
ncbi:hypothetical protein C8J57DRAFT_1349050 [Mycena rebaudengoi]|nr:hypothetical protein C8J57DRAFT_1349050 [Mycena rebaudengoi]